MVKENIPIEIEIDVSPNIKSTNAVEKFNAFKAKEKIPPSKSFIDEKHPLKLTIKTSLEYAYAMHGDKLRDVFEQNLRTTPELDEFYKELKIRGLKQSGGMGNGAIIYIARDVNAVHGLIEHAKKSRFNIKDEAQIISQAESIIADPKRACEAEDSWLNYITSKSFTDSVKPLLKRKNGDRNDGFELN